jgi:hypothetical protein
MRGIRFLVLAAAAGLSLMIAGCANGPRARVGVAFSSAPVCPYGYYYFSPYNCAPYGYYGPEWFDSGLFIGAGPWFHGSRGFRGHVDNDYDPHHGYRGRFPDRGERPDEHHGMYPQNFKGNETRDGRGHRH